MGYNNYVLQNERTTYEVSYYKFDDTSKPIATRIEEDLPERESFIRIEDVVYYILGRFNTGVLGYAFLVKPFKTQTKKAGFTEYIEAPRFPPQLSRREQ